MSNESEDDVQCFLDVELETLRSIYLNELEVLCDKGYPASVALQLYPSTADNVDEQYVRMSLILDLPAEYPDVIPDIQIKNPRGLSDEKIRRIVDDLFSKAEERKGGSMLFELIECAKDHLTAGNRPSCQCAICLYGFTEHDVFTRTKCYHYFHSHCLSRYIMHQKKEFEIDKLVESSEAGETTKEIFCPVCRIPISFYFTDDCDFPPPTSAKEDSFTITEELKQLQNKMADLYEKQKYKGGIIDVEAEKKKFLLEISSVPSGTELASEIDQSNGRRSTAEEMCQDFTQKENDLFPSQFSKSMNLSRNGALVGRQNINRYQKFNRKGKDSNFIPSRSSETKNNKSYHIRKNDTGNNNKGDSEQPLLKELEGQNYMNVKSTSCVSTSVNDLEKYEVQKTDRTRKTAHTAISTCVTDKSTVNHDTPENYSTDNLVECVQNKHQHSNRGSSGPNYRKRYPNFNHHNDYRKQRQYPDNSGRKHSFTESRGSPCVGLSNRRCENKQQHPKQSDNLYQGSSGNFDQKIQNSEIYLEQPGRRGNYHGNWQRDEFNCPVRQNGDHHQSRQDFHRKPRYHSRTERYKLNRKEHNSTSCDTERTDCGDSKNHNQRAGLLQNSHSCVEEKSMDKHLQNIHYDFDRVSKDESQQQYSKGHGNVNRKNYTCKNKGKLQHEHHRYETRPRNRTTSYSVHQSSPLLPESCITRNHSDNISSKASASPDQYPNHPFRRPDGKTPVEVHKSNTSACDNHDFCVKADKVHGASTAAPDISSVCNSENYSPVLDSFSVHELKGNNNAALVSPNTNYSVSRPPPGFAKKVVYGLPSVKPPPGFSQS